jgi:pimeloyl-ACP methyl ester carboxylesterase
LLLVRLLGMKKVGEVLAKRMFPKSDQAAIREQFVQRWAENDRRAYLESLKAILNFDISDRVREITTPTLMVSADDDYIPVAAKEAVAARMPNARVTVIPDSRHGLPVEKPDAFNRVALDFLAQQ